jgi:hypothetical protein
MLKITALLCAALAITACGNSPTAPGRTPAAASDRVEQSSASDTRQEPLPPRKSTDEHGEPPGNLPPRP